MRQILYSAPCPKRSSLRDWRSRKAPPIPRRTATSTTAPVAASPRPARLPGGKRVPARWAGRERFVILETGFGLGLNFLATWQAWRRDPRAARRLHYVSIEKHPFSLQDLRTLHERYPELEKEATELALAVAHARAGRAPCGARAGQVVLTLFFADIKVARDLRLAADAFYLDGFSPAKNPDMWSPQLMRSLSRLAAPGATVATWSVASSVRSALRRQGLRCRSARASATSGRCWSRAYANRESFRFATERQAVVVGAGLAGAAVCERLCSRGWDVDLYERHAEPAQEASGNHAGTFHPIVTPDDSIFARLTRAGFLFSLSSWKTLAGIRWDPCGVLQLARDEKEEASQRASIAALGLPPEYAQYVTREEASAHAGVPVMAPGCGFPKAAGSSRARWCRRSSTPAAAA